MIKVAPRRHRFAPARPPPRRDERLRSLAIEQLCQVVPIGAAVLDASCNVLFCNREGLDLLGRWTAPRPTIKRSCAATALPGQILEACHRLRAGDDGAGTRRPNFGGRILVRHELKPNLSAVVALDRNPRDRRFALFCILLQDSLRQAEGGGRRDQLALLTLAERQVAKLVAEGLRNSDIAAALGKSVMTVKSQLGTIFAKLGVRSRTQLAAVLRSSAAA